MYLSQLLINPGAHSDAPRPGIDWVQQTYRVHQRLWMAFPDETTKKADPFFLGSWSSEKLAKTSRDESGFLFRIEPDPPHRILVQSKEPPHWDYAFQNAKRLLAAEPQVREFNPQITAGQQFRFRVVMLMVKRSTETKDDGTKQKREHPIRCFLPGEDTNGRRQPDPEFTAWWDRFNCVSEQNGFEVDKELRSVTPVTNLHMKPSGNTQPARFNAASFEGVLKCTDQEKLERAVCCGIGRGKSFGMGLLSLAKIV